MRTKRKTLTLSETERQLLKRLAALARKNESEVLRALIRRAAAQAGLTMPKAPPTQEKPPGPPTGPGLP